MSDRRSQRAEGAFVEQGPRRPASVRRHRGRPGGTCSSSAASRTCRKPPAADPGNEGAPGLRDRLGTGGSLFALEPVRTGAKLQGHSLDFRGARSPRRRRRRLHRPRRRQSGAVEVETTRTTPGRVEKILRGLLARQDDLIHFAVRAAPPSGGGGGDHGPASGTVPTTGRRPVRTSARFSRPASPGLARGTVARRARLRPGSPKEVRKFPGSQGWSLWRSWGSGHVAARVLLLA